MSRHEHHHQKSRHHNQHSHHDHHRMMIRDFRKRFWISSILTVPVLLLSPMLQQMLGFTVTFRYDTYVLFICASTIFFYGGWPFLKGLADELGNTNPGMMTLIALAISVAYTYSSAVVFGLVGKVFFWELATLIDVMLLGHWIEMKSVLGASRSLELLVELMPSEAHRITEDGLEEVPLDQLQKGDLVQIKPGEKIPADGVIVEGEGHLNESMLTGESKPVKKKKNDEVIGGSINGKESLKVKVQKTGQDAYLSKVIDLVQQAQSTKSKTQRLGDRAAFWLTLTAITVGLSTLFAWLAYGQDFVFSLERMVTVMVITCPHALGLAIPLVVSISTAMSAQNGLLIRNRTAFESSRSLTSLVFDKTGTLTVGAFGVTNWDSLNGKYPKEQVLKYAASLEQHSEHPIGIGIVRQAQEKKIKLQSINNFQNITGEGIEGKVGKTPVKVVSPGYLRKKDISVPDNLLEEMGTTTVFVLVNDELAGYISLADQIRPESKPAIETLQNMGIDVIMMTGDNESVAKSVSEELGMDGYFAEVLPHEKQQKIKELQQNGEFVAMTGDGVNDAPALAQADVGIAVGSGTDVAAETADIILVESNPQDVTALIAFGKATYRKMIQNLIWATGYNVVAIPLAAGVLYSWNIMISPAIGAVLMSLSTVVVAINAQFLKGQLQVKK